MPVSSHYSIYRSRRFLYPVHWLREPTSFTRKDMRRHVSVSSNKSEARKPISTANITFLSHARASAINASAIPICR
ncbi:hypothetical protein ES288_A05G238300v1 [Gossypium darwinii]|uniref:Uncharacterized protein n=2 Tax=Gossypium TaxID=3633 RepID=A0A5D2QJJ7_GOSTO|nr:hypothetical protein ES288_A05G238300v1 [Gossypium darwinii]TYI28398.1 hypothetical protein ES332_A05G242200v1 [Gossypium tomentosum]